MLADWWSWQRLVKMRRLGITFAIFAITISLVSSEIQTELSAEECDQLGFNVGTLKCSACEKLTSFNLEEIWSDCLKCCVKDVTKSHERYAQAIFEVCECNLNRFPQVNAFVKSEMKDQWGSKVKVRHVRGVLPTVILKSADGRTQKSLNVEKWDTDTITEFLNDWLE